jgi:hypothetical protein
MTSREITAAVVHTARVALTAAVLIAATVLGGSHATPAAHANGDPAFTLRNFDYFRTAYLVPIAPGSEDEDLVHVHHWRVTVCTPGPARLRILAIPDSDRNYRFVRRQPAGCTRHHLRGESEFYPEGYVESRLRVAWRHHHQRTSWLGAGDPVTD